MVAAGAGYAAGALPGNTATAASTSAGTLSIGSILPLSGSLGPDAILLRNGMTLAIDQANAAGGVAGRQIKHVVIDADVTSDDSVQAATAQLVTQRVHAVVNGFVIAWRSSYEAWAKYGAPYLHASSSEDQRAYVAARHDLPFFQTTPTEAQYGTGIVSLMDRTVATGALGATTRSIQFITREVPHTANIEAGARAAAKSAVHKWTMLPTVDLAEPVASWTSHLAGIAARRPRLVVINTVDPNEATEFIVAAQRRKLPSLLYYPNAADSLTGAFKDGVLTARVAGRYADAPGRAFVTAYTKAFGRGPDLSYASCGYDAMQTLLAAWGQSSPDNFPAVCDVLRRQTWRGVQGAVNFGNSGQTALSYPAQTADPSLGVALLIAQRRGGADKIVDPAPYASTLPEFT